MATSETFQLRVYRVDHHPGREVWLCEIQFEGEWRAAMIVKHASGKIDMTVAPPTVGADG